MTDVTPLIQLMQKQMEAQQKQMETLVNRLTSPNNTSSIPSFVPFDPTSELWKDYYARFGTFAGANSIPKDKVAQVFLTNQTPAIYKLLGTLGAQQTPPKDINALSMEVIAQFMKGQFDPKRFIVRERFKFWSDMQRKPGETVSELAARIRQDAATCDFASIKDPQDEAMRTRFICSVGNEAVLKAVFKISDDELTFNKAVQVAVETEDAAKVAKETVHGSKASATTPVLKMSQKRASSSGQRGTNNSLRPFPKGMCPRCGKTNHVAKDCRFINSTCRFCQKKGHIAEVCLRKKSKAPASNTAEKQTVQVVRSIFGDDPVLQQLRLDGKSFSFEVDSGAKDNFCSTRVWTILGKPTLQPAKVRYVSATGACIPVRGTFNAKTSLANSTSREAEMTFNVSTLPHLNLLGRTAIRKLDIDVCALLREPGVHTCSDEVHAIVEDNTPHHTLRKACQQLCTEFPDLFKTELGCLKNFELEVAFKADAKPVFCKPRRVPFAILEDLNHAYDAGIKKGVWVPAQFNEYGTPVVPIVKTRVPGQQGIKLRVCGDYSVTVNPQLATHRHPMPLPEDLMRKLGGGYYFTKIDLADAYNQIKLAPDSQKKLALSTHRGVLLQTRLPFGISSAPGYFQEIMENLTSDLRGVAVFLDDILVSGATAEEHLHNLRALLCRLQDKGLRCNREKCAFAQSSVEYLGHTLSRHGIAKGHKVDAIAKMPPPTNVASLHSFLGSVQFYSKFIPNLSTLMEPLTRLTRKNTAWRWTAEAQAAFQQLKDVLCTETVLAHFDPSTKIGIACDASEVGIGAVLFHRYADGTERPIANASKTLTDTQRCYSQIQKEALAVIYGLQKFHQFLYGRNFILVTDHKPLLSLFSPTKGTPALAANRLARWALTLSQYDYSIEYRRTADHSNADALSRLPTGEDTEFDGEEQEADVSTVCTIKFISRQLNPMDTGVLAKESQKDPVISAVMRYVREGWPHTTNSKEVSHYKKLEDSLTTESGCLLFGSRIVIPDRLREQVLQLLHLGHFGMQRMKQLARSVVYWPHIDVNIEKLCRTCTACAEHQNKPPKPANHPWMLPEKPWSRLHIDHAINFLGTNWLVLVDAYSKYPCIHPTNSTSTKATTDLLEIDFAHFGYPHTLVTDNATTFLSDEFQVWCRERGIVHLTGAPYHPATNGAAERLVQSFKQSLKKSSLPPKTALQEFLLHYRRTPLDSGHSPSELLNGRQIRCKLDAILPSPAHAAQGKQARGAVKSQRREHSQPVSKLVHTYTVGEPCYALYCGPKRNRQARWVPAVVTKIFGTRSVNVRVSPRGPTWRRHIEQLRPRYGVEEDADPGDAPTLPTHHKNNKQKQEEDDAPRHVKRPNPRLPMMTDDQYGPDNPRRSERLRQKEIKIQHIASGSPQLAGRCYGAFSR